MPVKDQLDRGRARFVREGIVIVVCEVQGHHGAAQPTVNERRDRQKGHHDAAAN